jgi:hypothetical protein
MEVENIDMNFLIRVNSDCQYTPLMVVSAVGNLPTLKMLLTNKTIDMEVTEA